MKKMVKVMRKIAVGIVLVMAGGIMAIALLIAYLMNEGNLSLEKQESKHYREVYVDGVLVEDQTWTDTEGYEVAINLLDGIVIRK